jgi:hypothetical protein
MQQRPLDLIKQQIEEGGCGDELRKEAIRETRLARTDDPWTG